MRVELDVEVLDFFHLYGLHDGNAVDEMPRLGQQAVEEHRMMRRDPEIACGHVDVDGFSHDLGFTRTRARPGFNNDDCDLLNELVPHLRRAFEISRALEERAATTQSQPRQSTASNCTHTQIQTDLALSPAQARLAMLLPGPAAL